MRRGGTLSDSDLTVVYVLLEQPLASPSFYAIRPTNLRPFPIIHFHVCLSRAVAVIPFVMCRPANLMA